MKADIDIDLADRSQLLKLLKVTPARIENDGKIRRHNTGVYANDIPADPVNGCAAIEYIEAAKRGYFKIDLLNMSVYSLIKDQAHYDELLNQPINWSGLWEDPKWASQLVHIGNYTQLLGTMKPDSITRMAAFISIIRPGKRHLQNKPWAEVFQTVWNTDNTEGYAFKKSHAISYSLLVTLHMRLLGDID